ncbi:hypothetical protein J5N97_013953 [Dioscorea zingiberensis]|uniref:Uncharacterized protein n=1 Tax=Dioscorea zingiberensis TaxID=325984 RepID=A0A9D5CT70_9LILI|nr:hypothetical protein J5N97_013953 [Dioscorea zingiberensis]
MGMRPHHLISRSLWHQRLQLRKPTRTQVSVTDSTGFGRTISKKSLDMALKHMDIRQNIGGIRGTSLFPHSVRSSLKRIEHLANQTVQYTLLTMQFICMKTAMEQCLRIIMEPFQKMVIALVSLDPCGSYRYDAILLKEDSKNMSWLHSIDDKSDQSPEFDHGLSFALPEPFAPL